MFGTFYDGHDELYHRAKFREIKQRALAVGAKIWCLSLCFFTGRMPRSGKLPVLNLLTDQKSGISPEGATRWSDSRQTWHGRRAPRVKISLQSVEGWECGPTI